jgi:hypothetical protein
MTPRPDVLAFVSSDKIRDPSWTPAICACGACSMPSDVPERLVDNVMHGVLICYREKGESQ